MPTIKFSKKIVLEFNFEECPTFCLISPYSITQPHDGKIKSSLFFGIFCLFPFIVRKRFFKQTRRSTFVQQAFAYKKMLFLQQKNRSIYLE